MLLSRNFSSNPAGGPTREQGRQAGLQAVLDMTRELHGETLFLYHGHQASILQTRFLGYSSAALRYVANPLGIRNWSVSRSIPIARCSSPCPSWTPCASASSGCAASFRRRAEDAAASLYTSPLLAPCLSNSWCCIGRRGLTGIELTGGRIRLLA